MLDLIFHAVVIVNIDGCENHDLARLINVDLGTNFQGCAEKCWFIDENGEDMILGVGYFESIISLEY